MFPAKIVANAGYDDLPDHYEDMEDIALVARAMSDMDLVRSSTPRRVFNCLTCVRSKIL